MRQFSAGERMIRRALRRALYPSLGKIVRGSMAVGEILPPYQSFYVNGVYTEGRRDTLSMYYGLNLPRNLEGWSWLDLGCNEGSIVMLAAQDGAHPVVGVELYDKFLGRGQERVAQSGLNAKVVRGDIIEYVRDADSFDVVSLFAMVRHVHRAMMVHGGHSVRNQGQPYLIYDAYRTIIKGEDNPVKEEMDGFLETCLAKARRHFVCSIKDQSGLIRRRKEDVIAYFRGLSDRVGDVEIYSLVRDQQYIVIQVAMK